MFFNHRVIPVHGASTLRPHNRFGLNDVVAIGTSGSGKYATQGSEKIIHLQRQAGLARRGWRHQGAEGYGQHRALLNLEIARAWHRVDVVVVDLGVEQVAQRRHAPTETEARQAFEQLRVQAGGHNGDLDWMTCEKRDTLGVIWYDFFPLKPLSSRVALRKSGVACLVEHEGAFAGRHLDSAKRSSRQP
ncbi:MAG: hypothetical protein VCA18_13195 [Opitutales bacterium]